MLNSSFDASEILEKRVRGVAELFLICLGIFLPFWRCLLLLLEVKPVGSVWIDVVVFLWCGIWLALSRRVNSLVFRYTVISTSYALFLLFLWLVWRSEFALPYVLGIVALAAASNSAVDRLGYLVAWALFGIVSVILLWNCVPYFGIVHDEFTEHTILPATVAALLLVEITSLIVMYSRNMFESVLGKVSTENARLQESLIVERIKASDERYQSLMRLAQTMAHDARSPFALLSLCLQRLKTMKNEEEKAVLIEKVSLDVQRSVLRMEAVLADILEFQGKTEYQLEATPFVSFLREQLETFFATRNGVNINLSYSLESCRVLNIDRAKTGRIFQNIILNAVEAVKGNGCVWVKTRDVLVRGESMVEVIFGNNGPQVPDDVAPKIFDPFFTANKARGSGLGLSVVQRFVEGMGGSIVLKGNVNQCVEFALTLPVTNDVTSSQVVLLPMHSTEFLVHPRDVSGVQGGIEKISEYRCKLSESVSKLHGQPVRILIADDERNYAESLSAMLNFLFKGVGAVFVEICTDPCSALSYFSTEKPDIAILDLNFGNDDLDGHGLLQKFRASGSKAFVCIHSNNSDAENLHRAVGLGVNTVYPKPMTLEHLFRIVQEAISVSKAR